MSFPFIFVIVILAAALYLWSVYNSLVTLKTRIKAAIQEIGNQLKRQSDLVPNLVSSVKGYMQHEKAIFDELTEARKSVIQAVESGQAQQIVEAGSRLQSALAPIRVVLESNPQLQAAGPTTQLMNELTDTADKVMYARRTLIDLSADYNIRINVFPSNLAAKLFGFKMEAGLTVPADSTATKVESTDLNTPKVELQ